MSNRNRIFLLLGLLVIAAIYYSLTKPSVDEEREAKGEPLLQKQEQASRSKQQPPSSRAEMLRNRTPSLDNERDARVIRYTDGSADLVEAITLSKQFHQSPDPHNDLELVAQLLEQYRLLYQENPVGTENFEFTTALTGENAKQVNFIDPESAALTSANELVDRWGSPFKFHPISGTEMSILSFGPDQTLWTEDDLALDE